MLAYKLFGFGQKLGGGDLPTFFNPSAEKWICTQNRTVKISAGTRKVAYGWYWST